MNPQTPTIEPQQPEQSSLPPDLPHTPPANASRRRSLVIALVVAAVLLLLAICIALWMIFQANSGNVVGNTNATKHVSSDQSTQNVKKVSFVEPPDLPTNYVKRDQSTTEISTIYYFDTATSCGITTSVLKLGGPLGTTPKDVIINSAKTAESLGVKTTKSTDIATLPFKDAAGTPTYTFSSIELEQEVNVQGVDFKKQHNAIAFKQFGEQVASIGYSCKAETWDTKKTELLGLIKTFKVKAER